MVRFVVRDNLREKCKVKKNQYVQGTSCDQPDASVKTRMLVYLAVELQAFSIDTQALKYIVNIPSPSAKSLVSCSRCPMRDFPEMR